MTKRTEKTYYLARAKIAATNNFAKKGQWAVFTWSDEGGGWPQLLNTDREENSVGGKHFEKPPTQAELSWWQGMPLNITFDPATVEVLKVTEVHEKTVESVGAPEEGEGKRKPGTGPLNASDGKDSGQ